MDLLFNIIFYGIIILVPLWFVIMLVIKIDKAGKNAPLAFQQGVQDIKNDMKVDNSYQADLTSKCDFTYDPTFSNMPGNIGYRNDWEKLD